VLVFEASHAQVEVDSPGAVDHGGELGFELVEIGCVETEVGLAKVACEGDDLCTI